MEITNSESNTITTRPTTKVDDEPSKNQAGNEGDFDKRKEEFGCFDSLNIGLEL